MRKYFLHIICLSALFQVTACEKEKNKPEYTVSGTLRESCGAPPKAGAYLELFQDASGSGLSQSQTLHTTTDNQGRFSFTYKDQTNIPLSLYYGTPTSSTNILLGIPAEKNIELGDIYINNKITIILKLNSVLSYTSADTLHYAIGEIYGYKSLPGPFTNGILDTFYTHKGFTIGFNSYNVPVERTAIYWGIGYSDFYQSAISGNTSNPYHKIPFTVRGNCQVDTAYLNIP